MSDHFGTLCIKGLRLIIHGIALDYFLISETKLDNSFPNAQLTINNYEIRAWRDKDKHGGGLIEFVRKGLACKYSEDMSR